MENLKNIDTLFRDGLSDYSPPPPANGWDRLEKELSKSKKAYIIPMWVRVAASIFLVGGTVTMGWFFLSKSGQAEQEIIAQQDQAELNISEAQTASTDVSSESFKLQQTPAEAQSEKPSIEPKRLTAKEATASFTPEQVSETLTVSAEMNNGSQLTETISQSNSETNIEYTASLPYTPSIESPTDLSADIAQKSVNTLDINDLIIQRNILSIQEEQKSDSKTSWTVGGLAGPQYTYRNVDVNAISYNIDDYDKYESGVTTYAGGFQVAVEPSPRFSIQSGLYYSKIGQVKTSIVADPWNVQNNSDLLLNSPPSRVHESEDIVNSTGNITFDKSMPPSVAALDPNAEWVAGSYTAEQYFEFIEIPLIVRYRIIDRKFDMDISSGLWANLLIGNTAFATDNQTSLTTRGETQDINTLNYAGSISLGFAYPLAPRISFSLEPFVKYYLKPINSNPQTDVYPYSMGVMSGVKYSF